MKRRISLMICLLLVLAGAAGTVLAQEQAGPAGITILSPQPNDVVQVANLAVAGTAIGLPEGNVVVRALDAQGNILAEQPTVVDPTTGAWQAILNPQVEAGTQGAIYAYSPSPADGTIVAEATIPVLFGQPAPEQPVAPVEPEQPGPSVVLPIKFLNTQYASRTSTIRRWIAMQKSEPKNRIHGGFTTCMETSWNGASTNTTL